MFSGYHSDYMPHCSCHEPHFVGQMLGYTILIFNQIKFRGTNLLERSENDIIPRKIY